MIKTLFLIYRLLNKKQKINFLLIQVASIIASIFEVLSLISIAFFVKNLLNPQTLDNYKFLFFLQNFFEFKNNYDFLAAIIIIVIFISAVTNILNVALYNRFTHFITADFGSSLYEYYIKEDYTNFNKQDYNYYLKILNIDLIRFSENFLKNFLLFTSRLVLTIFIFIVLAIYNFQASFISLVVVGLIYFFIYRFIKKKIRLSDFNITNQFETLTKNLAESFYGIKDLKFYQKENHFINLVKQSFFYIAKNKSRIGSIAMMPRYLIEFIALFLIILVIVFAVKNGATFESLLSSLALFIFAGYKLLPAVQNIYYCYTDMKSSSQSFYKFSDALKKAKFNQNSFKKDLKNNFEAQSINLKNIDFSYLRKETKELKNINISLTFNKNYLILGKTGSGKSTLVDLILGFIKQDKGEILINNNFDLHDNIIQFREKIGYVPQSISLINDTWENNIVSFSKRKIDKNLPELDKIIKICDLSEISNLKESYIGEKGKYISGGQKQKIGFARALYDNPEILILDEATNSMDPKTESIIMRNVINLKSLKSIICISHNITLSQYFDEIILIENGKVIFFETKKNFLENEDLLQKYLNNKDIRL